MRHAIALVIAGLLLSAGWRFVSETNHYLQARSMATLLRLEEQGDLPEAIDIYQSDLSGWPEDISPSMMTRIRISNLAWVTRFVTVPMLFLASLGIAALTPPRWRPIFRQFGNQAPWNSVN